MVVVGTLRRLRGTLSMLNAFSASALAEKPQIRAAKMIYRAGD